MAQMTLPSEPSYRRTSYSELKGVDFSVDPALVDRKHSPDALNMISDRGGNPIKRKGFKLFTDPTVNYGTGYVQNLWSFVYHNNRYIVFTVAGSTLANIYVTNESGERVLTYAVGASSSSVPTTQLGRRIGFYTEANSDQIGFYIVGYKSGTTANYLRLYFDGNNVLRYATVAAKIPTVIIGRLPEGGGSVYEGVNLLTRERTEQFYNPDGKRTFVTASEIDTTIQYSPSGLPVVIQYKDENNQWQYITQGVTVTANTVTISSTRTPPVPGEDNIKIRYFRAGDGNASKVLDCEVYARNSGATSEQLFFSGNPSYRSSIYYSAPNDVTYFPDLNYINVGGETRIMGFCNMGENLGVVKESTSNDSTLFMLYQTSLSTTAVSTVNTYTNTTTTETEQIQTYAIKRTAAGIGAISKYAFSTLNDEPLFLSPNGVYGVVSTNTTSEKVVRNRSRFLDAKLAKETLATRKDAIATTWDNYYVLAMHKSFYTNTTDTFIQELDETGTPYWVKVDEVPGGYDGPVMTKTYDKPEGRLYILDGRHKTNDQSGNTNYGYEAYYWEGVSANCICAFEDTLLFGGKNGRVYKFKDTGNITDYSDEYYVTTVVTEDGESTTTTAWEQFPIIARWSTPNDNDGASEYFKTMQKKGTMCTTAPYAASSVKVYISADSADPEYLGMVHLDVSDIFQAVDFTRLSFDPRTGPRDVFFKKKKKKYIRLRIILENDALNEPFGVYEIVKTYILQRFAKGYTLRK